MAAVEGAATGELPTGAVSLRVPERIRELSAVQAPPLSAHDQMAQHCAWCEHVLPAREAFCEAYCAIAVLVCSAVTAKDDDVPSIADSQLRPLHIGTRSGTLAD
jgi:hypothetical protein